LTKRIEKFGQSGLSAVRSLFSLRLPGGFLGLMTMFIERAITFVVLGFFVFVADVGSWWNHGDLRQWYGNYMMWIALIAICYISSSRLNTQRNSFNRETHR